MSDAYKYLVKDMNVWYKNCRKLTEGTLVIIKNLSAENRASLENVCLPIYLEGNCYEFATAICRGTGFPMIGIMKGDVIRHVVVKDNEGKFMDARGIVTYEDLGRPFDLLQPYTLKEVTEEDLKRIRPIHSHAIEQASFIAEALWPDLPWKESCRILKVRAFLNDLENLCKKHDLWIRAPYKTTQIVIDRRHGDESFCVEPVLTGQYFFDRVLSDES